MCAVCTRVETFGAKIEKFSSEKFEITLFAYEFFSFPDRNLHEEITLNANECTRCADSTAEIKAKVGVAPKCDSVL